MARTLEAFSCSPEKVAPAKHASLSSGAVVFVIRAGTQGSCGGIAVKTISMLFSKAWLQDWWSSTTRGTAEYERLRELAVNQEVKVMEMTWEERMEVKYTQKGIEQGVEALREVVLQLLGRRFGTVPDTVRRKVEAIDEMKPLADLASRVLDIESIDDIALS
jgi:hypothetical protein